MGENKSAEEEEKGDKGANPSRHSLNLSPIETPRMVDRDKEAGDEAGTIDSSEVSQ